MASVQFNPTSPSTSHILYHFFNLTSLNDSTVNPCAATPSWLRIDYHTSYYTLISPHYILFNTHSCPGPSHSDSCDHTYLLSCSYVYSGVSSTLPSTSNHHPLTFYLQQRYYHLHLFALIYIIFISHRVLLVNGRYYSQIRPPFSLNQSIHLFPSNRNLFSFFIRVGFTRSLIRNMFLTSPSPYHYATPTIYTAYTTHYPSHSSTSLSSFLHLTNTPLPNNSWKTNLVTALPSNHSSPLYLFTTINIHILESPFSITPLIYSLVYHTNNSFSPHMLVIPLPRTFATPLYSPTALRLCMNLNPTLSTQHPD